LGSHGRRLPGRLGLPLLVALILIASACHNGDDPEILPTRNPPAEKGDGVVGAIENSAESATVTTVVVRDAAPFIKEEFITQFIRKNHSAVTPAFNAFKKIACFPGFDGKDKNVYYPPADVKVLRAEYIATVQRASYRGKTVFAQDLEIFTTVHAAIEKMDVDERVSLFDGWKKKAGAAEPSRPLTKVYPLFWLREAVQFWNAGGQEWWWAYHALKQDPSFSFSPDKGAVFQAPDGTIYRSRPE